MLVDLATLTGACGVALGEYAAGLWRGNSSEVLAQVQQAALSSGERVWPMPLFEEYSAQIRSGEAQLKNSGGNDFKARPLLIGKGNWGRRVPPLHRL